MTTTERLQSIRAFCVRQLEIAAKRTPGEWESGDYRPHVDAGYVGMDSVRIKGRRGYASFADGNCVFGGEHTWQSDGDFQPIYGKVEDFQFIASCAGPAEAGWRATIAAIDLIDGLKITDGQLEHFLAAYKDYV